ncbi:MAG TPA: M20/M25/M40 family metallo-hydrolase [Fimbriimonas sp.]
MRKESLDFLRELVDMPSPSGYEERAAALYRFYLESVADRFHTDLLGNTWAALNPDAPLKVMLAGHIDEIGFIVNHISEEGLVHFKTIGDYDVVIPAGQRVWIHSKERVPGVIGRKAIHILEDEKEQDKAPDLHGLWIDLGVDSRSEAEALVELGDPATIQSEFQMLQNGRAIARGFDNKVGAYIVAEALRLLKDELDPGVGVYAVATVQEEVGFRGAYAAAFAIGAQVGLAVDVSHATDHPGMDEARYGRVRIGKGPTITRGPYINPHVFRTLREAAVEDSIPFQIEVAGQCTGTDATAMQTNRDGMATGLIGIPLRYMHTPCELLSLEDVQNAARLIAAFCRRLTAETDFTPRAG